MATMEAMTREAFDDLNALGETARQGFRDAFAKAGVVAQVTGQGSLMRLHLTGRSLTGYRNVYPSAEESERMSALHRHLLNTGQYISNYGLMCLSTVNTRDQVDALISHTVEGLTRLPAAAE